MDQSALSHLVLSSCSGLAGYSPGLGFVPEANPEISVAVNVLFDALRAGFSPVTCTIIQSGYPRRTC